eukprot:TRINITY_DN674_c0_g1_i4.p1 TRINITY_DN674_c0_g1~~TRINITY_DN674_c0_g1_i4.p1  ORF type:complete len:728 (-),score=138.05 TRINITY_DN674_c0_g1_i4:60-2243(-)
MSDLGRFSTSGTFADFGIVLAVDTAIFVAVIVIFQLLRSYSKLEYFYAPKLYEDTAREEQLPNSKRWFGWIKDTLSMTDQRLYELRGLDALMHVAFLRVMVFLFISLLPVAAAIIATNATGSEGVSGVPRLSLANVAESDNRMWAHVACGYVFTALTLFWLYKGYRIYEYFSEIENSRDMAHNYTLMIRGVPKGMDLNDALLPYARPAQQQDPIELEAGNNNNNNTSGIAGGELIAQHWANSDHTTRKLQRKKHKLIKKREYCMAYEQEAGEPLTKKKGRPWNRRTLVMPEEYEREQQAVEAKIGTRRNHFTAPTRTVFLTYSSVADVAHIGRANQRSIWAKFRVRPSPYVNDVLWSSLGTNRFFRAVRTFVVCLVVGALLFFWAVPVGFVQALANLDTLAKVRGLEFLAPAGSMGTGARGFVQGVLPPLILIIFFALLPKILRGLNKLRAPSTYTRLDSHVLASFYAFEVINVFLVSTLAGGIFKILSQLQADLNAQTVANLLGSSIPGQSVFFVNLVLSYALYQYPLKALRIGELIISRLKVWRSKTNFESREKQKPKPRLYSGFYGIELLVFTITIVYAFTAPFIIPWAILFFMLAYLFAKYDAIYVTVPINSGKGALWNTAFNCCISGLLMAHLLLIAVLSLKGFPEGAAISPMPVLTVLFCVYVKRRFKRDTKWIAASRDAEAPRDGRKFRTAYVDPVLDERRDIMEDQALNHVLEEGKSQM